MKKISKAALISYFILVTIATLSWIAGTLIVEEIKNLGKKQEVAIQEQKLALIEEKSTKYPDYEAIKGDNPDPDMKVLSITNECPKNGCVNKHPANIEFDGIKNTYKAGGKFSRAYLYAELLVDYDRPLTSWDDLYFKINNQGGHLIVDENILLSPPNESSSYLYNLGSISYYPSISDKNRRSNKKTNIDFFYLLENEAYMTIHSSISSNRPGRVMKEVSIYYECLENSDCSITKQ